MSALSPGELETRRKQLENARREEITLDRLTRDFAMFQRRRGHRHSTDDLTTAWYAVTHAPPSVEAILDLGSGIGTVGLSALWKFPNAKLTAIEVQEVSYALLIENLSANDLTRRVRAIHGDLRSFEPESKFDLVTGSPPYFDVKDGIVSSDTQRAAARFELHGDVRDYCRAASRALADGGRFIFCFPSLQIERAKSACVGENLRVLSTLDVVPKVSIAPLFTLFCCALEKEDPSPSTRIEPALVVRNEDGEHTEAMLEVRRTFGFAL